MTRQPTKRLTAAQRGYGARWQRYRARYLREHPWCVMCLERKRYVAATVVDHIKPHRGDMKLFWKPANHQPLCKACHDGAKSAAERSGKVRGCDVNGLPLDPGHRWNR